MSTQAVGQAPLDIDMVTTLDVVSGGLDRYLERWTIDPADLGSSTPRGRADRREISFSCPWMSRRSASMAWSRPFGARIEHSRDCIDHGADVRGSTRHRGVHDLIGANRSRADAADYDGPPRDPDRGRTGSQRWRSKSGASSEHGARREKARLGAEAGDRLRGQARCIVRYVTRRRSELVRALPDAADAMQPRLYVAGRVGQIAGSGGPERGSR